MIHGGIWYPVNSIPPASRHLIKSEFNALAPAPTMRRLTSQSHPRQHTPSACLQAWICAREAPFKYFYYSLSSSEIWVFKTFLVNK
jgi:hypothetical protein